MGRMNRLLQFQFALVAAALLLLLVVALFPGKPRVVKLQFDDTVAAIESVQDQEDHAQRQQELDRRAQREEGEGDAPATEVPAAEPEDSPETAIPEPAQGETTFRQEDAAKPEAGIPANVAARLGGNTGAPAAETVYR